MNTPLGSLETSPAPAALRPLDNAGWRAEYEKYFTPNYGPRRLALVRGQGTRVWDAEGKEYLDFLTGISVNNLGHCHPRITAAIRAQAGTLVHCTNLYYIPVQIELARLLIEHSFADRLFFGNSGAEANEAAIKLARRWSHEHMVRPGGPAKYEIITMLGSFHGRTLATLTATGQDKVKKHFDPLVPGFRHAAFNDLDAVRAQITEHTCAIMMEPILGEGGIHIADEAFVRGVRRLCDERGLLLIFDEVQTGLGRTGKLWAYEHYGVEPDIMTIGKSLGGGLAMGAMLCRAPLAEAFAPGAHGSTMGGNPLTAAAGLAYVSELIEGHWPARAAEAGDYMGARLEEALRGRRNVRQIRRRGLMIGIDVEGDGAAIVHACERDGLLINLTAGCTLRIMPPLNVARDEIDRAVAVLARVLEQADR